MHTPAQDGVPTIALLTDFGLADPYVAQMKGVLLGMAVTPIAIVDVTHEVAPQAVAQAAFLLEATAPWFPPGAVFCCVVDPGVGTARGTLVVQSRGRRFVAPDNGLLTSILDDDPAAQAWDMAPFVTQTVADDAISATFHGRDLFAPLAGRLALGATPEALGRPMDPAHAVRLPCLRGSAMLDDHGGETSVAHVDRFGNVVLATSATELTRLAGWPGVRVLVRDDAMEARVVRTYAELPSDVLGLLAGSQGRLELAVNQGSAAARLSVRPGDVLRLAPTARNPLR